MSQPPTATVTELLLKWRTGDSTALDHLIPIVYRELHHIASARLRGEPQDQSLQATALVHEVYLRLIEVNRLSFENRAHFFALAARLMRQIVVDHARRRRAAKRGGGEVMLTLGESVPAEAPNVVDVLALSTALDELALVDERLSRVIELKFFAGLTIDETAAALDVSQATVERDWKLAKAWLFQRLSG